MQYSHYQGDCLHLQGYLELGGKYHSVCTNAFCMTLSTSPNSKRVFLTALSETSVGKNIVTKTAFGKFFLRRSLPPRGTSWRIL